MDDRQRERSMRFAILGVGQSFNFNTKQMEDTLQVETPQGVITIPTSNDAAQILIGMVMDGNGTPPRVYDEVTTLRTADGHQAVVGDGVVKDSVSIAGFPSTEHSDFPDGAEVFGEEPPGYDDPGMRQVAAPAQSNEGHMDQEDDEPAGIAPAPKLFAKKQSSEARLGRSRNAADRSGVASHGISRVDDKGNPMLPPAPDMTMDGDEEDPGEQI